jgi:succinate dehydrogenase cytochrome b556 subunit
LQLALRILASKNGKTHEVHLYDRVKSGINSHTQIAMPIGAVASILHRISDLLLALGIPCTIYLLEMTLQGPQGYSQVVALFDTLTVKGLAIIFILALTHRLLAGLRHLLSDIASNG